MSQPVNAATISRRTLLSLGLAAGAGALLGACGGTASQSSERNAAGGAWSFTDDRNRRVTTEGVPSRVVAFTGTAAALVDFGLQDRIVGVFGETTRADGTPDPQAGRLDVDAVTVLGNAWGQFNIEEYAALRPDLLVTHMYDPGALWYVPDESADEITRLAPTVAINVARVPMTQPIERYAELAASLGADVEAPAVAKAKTRFTDAAAAVRDAVKENPGITVMAASASPDLLYVSDPDAAADLAYFAELGVTFVRPDKTDPGGYYQSLSWENADAYAADLVLLDNRGTSLQPADLASRPSWSRLPAVKAEQITPWDSVPRFSYAGAAPLLERLADAIRRARKVS